MINQNVHVTSVMIFIVLLLIIIIVIMIIIIIIIVLAICVIRTKKNANYRSPLHQANKDPSELKAITLHRGWSSLKNCISET